MFSTVVCLTRKGLLKARPRIRRVLTMGWNSYNRKISNGQKKKYLLTDPSNTFLGLPDEKTAFRKIVFHFFNSVFATVELSPAVGIS